MPRIIRRNRLLGFKVTRILRYLTQFRGCKKKVAMSQTPNIPSLVRQGFLNNLQLLGFAMVPGNNGLFFCGVVPLIGCDRDLNTASEVFVTHLQSLSSSGCTKETQNDD